MLTESGQRGCCWERPVLGPAPGAEGLPGPRQGRRLSPVDPASLLLGAQDPGAVLMRSRRGTGRPEDRGGRRVPTHVSLHPWEPDPPSPEGDSPQRDVQGTRPWSFPRSKGGKWLDVVSGGGEPHPAPSSRTGGRAPAPPCLNVRWLLSGGLLSAHWAPTGSPSGNPFASNPVPQFNLEGGKAAPLTGEPALCPLPTRQGEGLSGADVSYSSFEIHLSWPKG